MSRSSAAVLGVALFLSVTGASRADVVADTVLYTHGDTGLTTVVPTEEACLRLGAARYETYDVITKTLCSDQQTGKPLVEQNCRRGECVSKRRDGGK